MDCSGCGFNVAVVGICNTLKASDLPAQFKTYLSFAKLISSEKVALNFSKSIFPSEKMSGKSDRSLSKLSFVIFKDSPFIFSFLSSQLFSLLLSMLLWINFRLAIRMQVCRLTMQLSIRLRLS